MSVYDRAITVITGITDADTADRILRALQKKRITVVAMKASESMFRRFHAHTRYLGRETGYGYEYWYNEAVHYAVAHSEWPVKVIPVELVVAGEVITQDIEVPESTTRATNAHLMCAYQAIEEGAREHGIALPEHVEYE